MNLKRLSLICVFAIVAPLASFTRVGDLQGPFKFFTTDRLGNIYVITPKNDIRKYDAQFKKVAEANFKVLGDATLIDAGNPMELFVFYKDQNKLVYFDNLLNYRGETDLNQSLNVNNITTICRSYDNGFWFFDPDNFKLKKYDKQGNLLTESVNLAGVSDTVLAPTMMLDDGRFVFMKAGKDKVLMFDLLGNYIKTVFLGPFNAFQTRESLLIYNSGDSLFAYNPTTFDKGLLFVQSDTTLPSAGFGIKAEGKRIYVHHRQGITVYTEN